MKFSNFREFRSTNSGPMLLGDIVRYLTLDLALVIRELRQGLRALTLDQNFQGWIETDLVIPAGTQVRVRNRLDPIIPRHRIILRSNVPDIDDGQDWTSSWVTIRNNAASEATVTVVFLK